jgi:hypothetical protein
MHRIDGGLQLIGARMISCNADSQEAAALVYLGLIP